MVVGYCVVVIKWGSCIGIVIIEDCLGRLDIMFFFEVLEIYGDLIEKDGIIIVIGLI